MRLLVLVALLGCGAPAPPPRALLASSTRLPAPPVVDPAARGASYLTAVAAQLQPRWAVFLEDCRLRLPSVHPLNAMSLAATIELAIGKGGEIVSRAEVEPSGNRDYDQAIGEVLADASPLPPPPSELASDDELVHVRWLFARDRRQAGPATARVVSVELPLLPVIDGLVARGEVARAATRVAAAPASDPDRPRATERVMIAALREALSSPDGAAQRSAVEACGRAGVHELSGAVRGLLGAAADPELRLAAIAAITALHDLTAAPELIAALHDELVQESQVALPRVAALVAIGHAGAAAEVVQAVLHERPNATALAALALIPIPALAARLGAWASYGDPAARRAVCLALPSASPPSAVELILRGLRDPDATVRATCADAAAREDRTRPDAATVRKLRELAGDRDRAVRARAIAALGVLDPAHPVHATDDPASEVRAALAATASEATLRMLAGDREPEVRAAALAALGERGRELAAEAAGDPSAAVRQAAIGALDDPDLLARLARDDSPEVATAALIRLTRLSGRAAAITPLLTQLAAAPAGSTERTRIALAWLLAP
ncbi:MAG TPA: HEAT repeat domain-containing protein [Kofleriaceae bacterium]|nr:HEAT repeat domain-containing protein [Kofleriaceae bacterium]